MKKKMIHLQFVEPQTNIFLLVSLVLKIPFPAFCSKKVVVLHVRHGTHLPMLRDEVSYATVSITIKCFMVILVF